MWTRLIRSVFGSPAGFAPIARAGAAFALAELLAGLTIGAFAARGRAEATIFLAFRPWLLVALAALVSCLPPMQRTAAYAAGLMAATAGEALLVALSGAPDWADEAMRGLLAGGLLALALDLAFAVARRAEPRFARLLGAALCLGLLLVPGPLRLFEQVALPPPASPVSGPRPVVALLSGLPLLWREDRPEPAVNRTIDRLAAEFRLRPIDTVTAKSLRSAPVLLAAQPRELSADGIEAIDRWVRMGGRAVLLADPDLRWPSELPLGDVRRPPHWATLAPLLAQWGITVSRADGRIRTIDIARKGGVFRRLVADGAGRLTTGPGCQSLGGGYAADCVIGRGRVLILADADLLDDALWVGPGAHGAERMARGGDNALLLAEWLDDLAGNLRDRSGDSVIWRPAGAPDWPFAVALLPALLLAALASAAATRKK